MANAFTSTECFSSTIQAISSLDAICIMDCSIEDVPRVVLDPDQRDIQFPPITPNQNVTISSLGGCRPTSVAPVDVVHIGPVDPGDFDDHTADTTSWTRPNNNALNLIKTSNTVLTRMSFEPNDGVTPGALWAFYRTYNYDSCGALHSYSGETRVNYASNGPCPD